ncbi:hypothetical protein GQX73_g8245 [Xylaria multiplex]|uniref:NCT transcriptional regulatory complex subunit A n=1 Tax=Xylaria multiplex TaxID=323545 RepID=A0A7C8MPU8_9PEZI|nr:hypothetical protein GQX73_g8245 [Xylaria multiplex]
MSATGDKTSYAPKSPDLSCFDSSPESHSAYNRPSPYFFPNSRTSTSGKNHSLQPPAHTQVRPQVPPQVQPQQLGPGSHNFSQPRSHHHYNNSNSISNGSAAAPTSTTITTITNHNAYHLPPQQHVSFAAYNDNSQHSPSPYTHQPGAQYYHPPAPQQTQQQQPQYPPTYQQGYRPHGAPPYYSSYTDTPTSTGYLSASQSLPQQPQQQHHHQQYPQQQYQQQQPPLVFNQPTTSNPANAMPRGKAAAQVAREPEVMDSPVRTKFPTARIKRIMQADEEVGKVAQQTPIAVGKALELFMVQLVHKSAEVAKEKNSKRITAPMLKQAIDSTNEWDFLREIVAKVAEEKEGAKSSGRPKAESDSDDDADVEVKKKGRGGRKKKAAA